MASKTIRTSFFLSFLLLLVSAKHNTSLGNKTSLESDASPRKYEIPSEWGKYLDPASEEFWTEGNYRPDKGFLLLLKDRTLENAKLWLLRMEKKAEVAEEVMALVIQAQEELVREGKIKDRYGMVSSSPEFAPLQKLYKSQLSSLAYFFVFKPGCFACEKLAINIKELPNVMPLQASPGEIYHWPGLPETKRASKETLKDYVGDGAVPVLVVADPTMGRVTKLVGVQSREKIMQTSVRLLKLRYKEKRK